MTKPICQDCVAEVQLFKLCRILSTRNCAAGVQLFKRCRKLSASTVPQLFKWCQNLSAGTVLQRCSCLSGVETYLPALCCRGTAVKAVWKPIFRHCIAEVQLFKRCRNLSAGTVLQGCSCLSGVEPICPHCVAEVQLFKRCRNLPAGHSASRVQLFKRCRNLSASTVLQGCSCFSSVATFLLVLCCRGAAV